MTRKYAEAMLEASETGDFVVLDNGRQVVDASQLYDFLTDNGEHPEEDQRFEKLSREEQLREVIKNRRKPRSLLRG